jgi:predicted XRE-type DNA-binding protein
MTADIATIQALRTDLALQIARHVERSGQNQVSMAKQLGIPQPTLSKIVNARVSDLSLELLIRIAVRAGLALVLQTGREPAEAGVYVTGTPLPQRLHRSKLADDARDALVLNIQRLTPQQRLEAQLHHSELLTALQNSARAQRAPKSASARARAP